MGISNVKHVCAPSLAAVGRKMPRDFAVAEAASSGVALCNGHFITREKGLS